MAAVIFLQQYFLLQERQIVKRTPEQTLAATLFLQQRQIVSPKGEKAQRVSREKESGASYCMDSCSREKKQRQIVSREVETAQRHSRDKEPAESYCRTPVAERNINRGKKEDDSTSLSNPEGDELLPLLDREVADLPQVHAEGEEEPLLQVHEEVVVVVK